MIEICWFLVLFTGYIYQRQRNQRQESKFLRIDALFNLLTVGKKPGLIDFRKLPFFIRSQIQKCMCGIVCSHGIQYV